MTKRSKRIPIITNIVSVSYKNGERTERELTPEEIEEWKKTHIRPIDKSEEVTNDIPSSDSN